MHVPHNMYIQFRDFLPRRECHVAAAAAITTVLPSCAFLLLLVLESLYHPIRENPSLHFLVTFTSSSLYEVSRLCLSYPSSLYVQ